MLDENRSWHQYIVEITMDSTKAVAGVYQTAMENGFVLPEEYQKDIDTFDEQLASVAEEVGMTEEEYLYYGAEYQAGGIEKASKNLCAFAKTTQLEPKGKENSSTEVTLKFKASDMASYVTGQVISCCGGLNI